MDLVPFHLLCRIFSVLPKIAFIRSHHNQIFLLHKFACLTSRSPNSLEIKISREKQHWRWMRWKKWASCSVLRFGDVEWWWIMKVATFRYLLSGCWHWDFPEISSASLVEFVCLFFYFLHHYLGVGLKWNKSSTRERYNWCNLMYNCCGGGKELLPLLQNLFLYSAPTWWNSLSLMSGGRGRRISRRRLFLPSTPTQITDEGKFELTREKENFCFVQ